jgi:hypothetical protein
VNVQTVYYKYYNIIKEELDGPAVSALRREITEATLDIH